MVNERQPGEKYWLESNKGIAALFIVDAILFAFIVVVGTNNPFFHMYQPGANAFAFKDWLPSPTLSPEQVDLYKRCPVLRYDPNAICAEDLLNTASSLFTTLWPIFGLLVVAALVLGLIQKIWLFWPEFRHFLLLTSLSKTW